MVGALFIEDWTPLAMIIEILNVFYHVGDSTFESQKSNSGKAKIIKIYQDLLLQRIKSNTGKGTYNHLYVDLYSQSSE